MLHINDILSTEMFWLFEKTQKVLKYVPVIISFLDLATDFFHALLNNAWKCITRFVYIENNENEVTKS